MPSRRAQRLVACALCAVLACSYSADALMARITCHCSSGDVGGVCLSASHVPSGKAKPSARPAAGGAECNMLCATKQEVLQRCENAAMLHVGEASCTSFTFDGCAFSCSDDCEHGCEVQRYDRVCAGMRVAM